MRHKLTLLVAIGTLSLQAATIFHVSPGGMDTDTGTKEAPFATLNRARDQIRLLKKTGTLPPGGVTVQLAPGIYPLADTFVLETQDSGTEQAPIIYRAAERGTVIISGGAALAGWHAVTDKRIRELLDPAAKDHVVCMVLGEDQLASIPGFANGGCGYRGKPQYPIGLYQNGVRLPVSRWPNKGFTKMGECLGHNEVHGHVGTTYTEGWFRFDDKRLTRWIGEPDLWFNGLWFHHWADQKMALETLDPVEKTIRLKDGNSHSFGFKKGQEFYAFNAIGEIDRPGEWAVDRTGRMIYLWPAGNPDENPVTVALRPNLITARGIQNVRFEDLIFENCLETAIQLINNHTVTISGSTLRHTGSWAVDIAGGSDCTVIGCDLYDLGEGGIKADGGDQLTLTPGNHLIENNHIHHFGETVNTYRPGASITGVGNRIRHNLIHHAQHQAVFFRGNNHIIENNILHDICLHTSDAGALYACARDWSLRGVIVRNNFIHSTGEGVDGCGSHGIYLDDFTSGAIIVSNIISSVGHAVTTCGNGNVIENNIGINSRKYSFALSSRGIDSFARNIAVQGAESHMITKLIDPRKPYTSETWKKRYPGLGPLLEKIKQDPIGAHDSLFCTMRNNVNVGGVPAYIRNEKKVSPTGSIENNIDIYEDPGFVDLKGFDLRLRPDSMIYKKLPGFKAPCFEKMGLYADSRRASPAVKFGHDIAPMLPVLSLEQREMAKLSLPLDVPAASGKIVVDGVIGADEWPPATSTSLPEIKWNMDGEELDLISRLCLAADRESIFIAVANDITADRQATADGHVWGENDGVEIAFAVSTSALIPSRVESVVFRGYADGHSESVTDGGLNETDAARAFENVRYAADHRGKGLWTAEWRIPFSSTGVDPEGRNFPILMHISVHRPVEKTTACWRQRWSQASWDVKGAYALCLESLGRVAFIPGQTLSVSRIDIQGRRENTVQSMLPGYGTEAPDWAQKWNRLVGAGGTVFGDRWQEFRLEFTPQEDTTVTLTLMGTQTQPPASLVWTYYDDFHIEGAELINPDFEEVGEDGKIPGWDYALDKNLKTGAKAGNGVVELGNEAASGSRAACTTHDRHFGQSLRITKGRKVTLTYKAKAALTPVK